MTNITGLNTLHPIAHASLFLDLCEQNAKSQIEEDKKLYEYYLDSLTNRNDSMNDVIPSVVELVNYHRKDSERMFREERKSRV
jgi:hypothetical protein